jgi:Putative zinc-finger
MTQPPNADEHVQLQLGLYVLGALTPEEHIAVDEHLARCAQCSAESEELAEVPPFLALITADDVDELTREPRPPTPFRGRPVRTVPARATAATRAPVTGDPALDGPAGPNGEPDRGTGPGRPARPTNRPSTPTPAGRPGRRSRGAGSRSRLVLSAIAVALVVGVAIGVWLRSSDPVPITLAGSDTNTVTGVSMSVTVVGHGDQSHVDASVRGLRSGGQYQLYAVDSHGQTSVVARWVAGVPPYAYSGDLQVSTDDLAFFTVTQSDGAVVVTVRVARSPQN